jgi:hypothetical protein
MEQLIGEAGDVELKRLRAIYPKFVEMEWTQEDGQRENKQTSLEKALASDQFGKAMDKNTDSQNEDEVVATFERSGDDSNSQLDRTQAYFKPSLDSPRIGHLPDGKLFRTAQHDPVWNTHHKK